MKTNLLFISFLLLFAINLSGQNYDFNTLKTDTKNLIKSPSNWDSNDYVKLGGTALITFGSMYIDKQVREWVLNNNQYRNSFTAEFGRYWGEPVTTLGLASGFYLFGLLGDNKANKKLGFEIGESALYTSVITMFFKYAFGRERPRENDDPFSFHPFSFRDDFFLSLNSGHTALAFSLSTIISKNTDSDALKVVSFIPAVLTAISRVYQNHHWTSDVILGSIIGITIADFVADQHHPEQKNNILLEDPPIEILSMKFTF